MKHATLSLCCLPILVAACADSGANYTPILDGPPTVAFQSDLSACQALARDQGQFDQETAAAAVLGAGAGALLGAADDDADAAGGAMVGDTHGTRRLSDHFRYLAGRTNTPYTQEVTS